MLMANIISLVKDMILLGMLNSLTVMEELLKVRMKGKMMATMETKKRTIWKMRQLEENLLSILMKIRIRIQSVIKINLAIKMLKLTTMTMLTMEKKLMKPIKRKINNFNSRMTMRTDLKTRMPKQTTKTLNPSQRRKRNFNNSERSIWIFKSM